MEPSTRPSMTFLHFSTSAAVPMMVTLAWVSPVLFFWFTKQFALENCLMVLMVEACLPITRPTDVCGMSIVVVILFAWGAQPPQQPPQPPQQPPQHPPQHPPPQPPQQPPQPLQPPQPPSPPQPQPPMPALPGPAVGAPKLWNCVLPSGLKLGMPGGLGMFPPIPPMPPMPPIGPPQPPMGPMRGILFGSNGGGRMPAGFPPSLKRFNCCSAAATSASMASAMLL
mmetsp:Transcript_68637/g.143339  ORF Transcript_68637/g.143339 Transcript_68637/m.143339 type:complete len:225 (-) Transcript_68637:113-787(-)